MKDLPLWHVTIEYKFIGLSMDTFFSDQKELWVELISRPWASKSTLINIAAHNLVKFITLKIIIQLIY